MNEIISLITENKLGGNRGIYSVCCAHPLIIEAALLQGLTDNSVVLIEATANQVNQFGGYTNMTPKDFVGFVHNIADQVNFPKSRIILGGDHLGPTCWTNEDAKTAMEKSIGLIQSYVEAGFKKIHLDTSMQCADDSLPLTDVEVAERAAILCKVAEQAAIESFGQSDLLYVVGTEVPPPGGAKEEINTLEVTPVINVEKTLNTHADIFAEAKLHDAWERVIALVVQPGVEFDNFNVFTYSANKAKPLKDFVEKVKGLVFEAHSTDYQPTHVYKELVRDHFAILKVGPQLTFALREALYALNCMEKELIKRADQSNLVEVCEEVMLNHPGSWNKFYPIDGENLKLYRHYSFSDRIRYYWPNERIQASVNTLIRNLTDKAIPMPLLSQFMPCQYNAVLNGQIKNTPKALIIHKIMEVTNLYSQACHFQFAQEDK
jgi:D-tagatose-1,6-bisphosphate aldolase subunit GatZ/KbaZ